MYYLTGGTVSSDKVMGRRDGALYAHALEGRDARRLS